LTLPDIVLLDVQLRGPLDGVQTALRLHDLGPIPIIFVTANTDEATFNRAKAARPFAFISKPFRSLDIQRAVELTLSLMAERTPPPTPADILYLEADRNYCHLFTATAQYTLATPLKVVEATLPAGQFLRVHRSYMVNLLHVDEVAENRLTVGGKTVALGHIFRDELLRRIRTV
jgi:DNA-binding LytR/AlgR family response regulator